MFDFQHCLRVGLQRHVALQPSLPQPFWPFATRISTDASHIVRTLINRLHESPMAANESPYFIEGLDFTGIFEHYCRRGRDCRAAFRNSLKSATSRAPEEAVCTNAVSRSRLISLHPPLTRPVRCRQKPVMHVIFGLVGSCPKTSRFCKAQGAFCKRRLGRGSALGRGSLRIYPPWPPRNSTARTTLWACSPFAGPRSTTATKRGLSLGRRSQMLSSNQPFRVKENRPLEP